MVTNANTENSKTQKLIGSNISIVPMQSEEMAINQTQEQTTAQKQMFKHSEYHGPVLQHEF